MTLQSYGHQSLLLPIPRPPSDWNTKFPPVGNQGNTGSCSAFSNAYYIATYWHNKENGKSIEGVTWDSIKDGRYDKLSSIKSPTGSVNLLYHAGCCSWAKMGAKDVYELDPPSGMTKTFSRPSEAAFEEAAGNILNLGTDVEVVFLDNDESIDKILDLLDEGCPVFFALDATILQSQTVMNEKGIIVGEFESAMYNHAQTAVGYLTGTEWDEVKNQ
jgi:hypothetical protein